MSFSSDSMSLKTSAVRFATRLLAGLAVSVAFFQASSAQAVFYRYELVAPVGGTAIPNPAANGTCNAQDFVFTVPDSFTVTSIAVGLNITHNNRGDLRAVLIPPNNVPFTLFAGTSGGGGDTQNNYDIIMSATVDPDLAANLPDGDTDPVAEPFYHRPVTVAGLNGAYGGLSSTASWTLRLCDIRTNNAGTFNRAVLVLGDGAPAVRVCSSYSTFDWGAVNGDGNLFANTTVDGITLTQTAASALPASSNPYPQNFRTQTAAPAAGNEPSPVIGGESGYFFNSFDDSGGGGGSDNEDIRYLTTWSFSQPVSDLRWVFHDADRSAANWEDTLRVVAVNTASPGSFVPFAIVTGGSQAMWGDVLQANGVNIDPASNAATATLDFQRAVTSFDSEYWAGDDVAPSTQQYIGYGDPRWCAFDYGDAPNTYGTLLASAGAARHVLGSRNLWLGAIQPDGEPTGAPNSAASGDEQNAVSGFGGTPVDEGGITFPACPNNGTYTVQVAATNNTGANASLVGYIDWDRLGTFFNVANERSATVTVLPGTATYPVTFSGVPANCGGTTLTYARFRIASTAAQVTSPTGLATNGEVEDYAISASTLPVTIASVESVRSGDSLSIRFSTASETSNAGFRIWGTSVQGKKVLLATLKSETADSFAPRRYAETVAAPGVTAIQIEDVSLFGDNRWHGPYAVGSTFGEEPEADEIDWANVRSDSGVTTAVDRMRAAERGGDAGDLVMGSFARVNAVAKSGLLLVRNEGIHRVTFEQLQAAGLDLSGILASRIAIVDNGVGVPRYVEASGGIFGPGAYIEFVARPVLTLASPVDVYVLRVDASKAVGVSSVNPGRGGLGVSTALDRHRPDRNYSSSSVNGDPWYDDKVFSWGAPATLTRTFDLPDLAGGAASLKIRTWGYGDFAGSTPDHHVVVKLNGSEIAQGRFDGASVWEPVVNVSDHVVASGNVLEIDVPGDTGYDFDYIGFEGFDVTYNRSTMARDERFQGTAPRVRAFTIGGFAAGEPVSVWKVSGNRLNRELRQPESGSVMAAGGPGDVYAASQSALYSPGIAPAVPAAQRKSTAEYLIVTHPSLAPASADLVALEESRGFTTELVTTDKIFAAYSDHASSAEALKSFLSASQAQGNLQYVLLVGADTSDPYDHLGSGSISFVPTDYRNFIPRVSFSPTDESLVDRNGDGVGDLPIGRLPVRTPSELEAVVAKLYEWEAALGSGQPSALLTAGLSDGQRALASVNEAYAASLPGWNTVLAQVDDSNTAAVRQQVLDGVNAGAHLVSFVGHSSPGQWDLTPILKWQDAATLTNAGLPNLITAWGCWNSYYVEPTIESLSARLLRQPDAGAAGTIGATTLTTESSHRLLGTLFFARVNAGAATVGEAFHGAKLDLAARGGAADAIYGMTLLGDPAMSLPHP